MKKVSKQKREFQVLIGLIEHYLKTGRPVGSNTLKEEGFRNSSSATLRNYFANLENQGYLLQQHTSGGRIPTQKALRFYAKEFVDTPNSTSFAYEDSLKFLQSYEEREISSYLQQCAEALATLSHGAVFLSSPRFDQDFISSIKLVAIDSRRYLCIIITDFGVIKTEVLQSDHKINSFSLKHFENYFQQRIAGHSGLNVLNSDEVEVASKFYNEIMVRFVVGYTNFIDEEIYRTGFSQLLAYPEFHDAPVLASTLSLFENANALRLILRECSSLKQMKYWIGDDLTVYTAAPPLSSVIAVPYYINHSPAGAIGILGPLRMQYRELFGLLDCIGATISKTLSKNIFKHKISFRQPEKGALYLNPAQEQLLEHHSPKLLENKN